MRVGHKIKKIDKLPVFSGIITAHPQHERFRYNFCDTVLSQTPCCRAYYYSTILLNNLRLQSK